MKCYRVKVYLAGQRANATIIVGMAYDLAMESRELAKQGYGWIWPITRPAGLYPAYKLAEKLRAHPLVVAGELQGRPRREKQLWKWLKRERWLRHWGVELQEEVGILPLKPAQEQAMQKEKPQRETLCMSSSHEVILHQKTSHKDIILEITAQGESAQGISTGVNHLALLLRGRNLYFSELLNGLKEMGFPAQSASELRANLTSLLIQGKIELTPANLPEENVCLRCGHHGLELTQCGVCGEPTWRCSECAEMGESLSCRPLLRRKDRGGLGEEDLQDVIPAYKFALSKYQEDLSQRLELALGQSKSDWLLWAVCGAGKTETTFGLIAAVLRRGGRVLFTSPRREVVKQMVERFGQAFPDVEMVGLFGGSTEKLGQGQLTVATVHQLVRFYQAFDLVIFDEVDAYPYKGDARLQSLLLRSKKHTGKIVYLSATPGEDFLAQARAGRLEILTLPARFHKRGVPVPELVALRLPAKTEMAFMPAEVSGWIDEAVERDLAQLYIFLPTRKMVETFGGSLKKHYAARALGDWVEFTHSQDAEREKKVEAFLRGDFPILVTSTIMERGVTVPKANVLILYADAEGIFDSQSLIQMAGRAGRSNWAPDGRVIFVGRRVSREMKKAKEWICQMNAEARERGLLDEGNVGSAKGANDARRAKNARKANGEREARDARDAKNTKS